jgi:hypothetical protein
MKVAVKMPNDEIISSIYSIFQPMEQSFVITKRAVNTLMRVRKTPFSHLKISKELLLSLVQGEELQLIAERMKVQ